MSNSRKLQILILEDQPDDCELLLDELRQSGFDPDWQRVETETNYLAALHERFDLILADYTLPQYSALQALGELKERELDIPLIIVTGTVSEEVAVACMKEGAADYLLKDRLTRLGQAVAQAVQAKHLREEKRLANIALRKREAYNRAVLNSLAAHIAVIDHSGHIVAVNEAWTRFDQENGGSPDQTSVGADYLLVCQRAAEAGDADARQALTGIRAVLDGSETFFVMEYPNHSPTVQRWFSMRVTPLVDGSGDVVIAHSSITDRKLAAIALEQELNLLRTLIDNLPDYIYIKDTMGQYVDANLETVAGIGATKLDNLIGKTDSDFYPEEMASQFFDDDQEVIRSGERLVNHEEQVIDHRTGQTRWTLTTRVPLRDKYDNITGLVGIGRDVTERKLSEELLRQSEERFSKAFYASPASVFIVRLSDGTIVDANKSFMELFGYYQAELIGQPIADLKIWVDEDVPLHLLAQMREQQYIRDWEGVFRTKLGEIRSTLASAELIKLDGEPCALTLMHDITDRKQAQEERMKAELLRAELEKERELLVLKEQFLSKLAHDFRTPLTVIQASSDLLCQYYDRLTADKRLRYAQDIQSQIKVMTDMMEEILVINRAQSGKLHAYPSPLDLVGFCRTLFEDMQLIDTAGHEFVFIAQGEFENIAMDEKLLRHILVNLLTNAIKYSPNGGKIRFELAYHNSYVVFRISDQGIGIPTEDQGRLFEEFHRAKNTGRIPGTGLGMSIVKKSVEAHSGSMEVDSKEGVGTAFTVRLPAHYEAAQE